MKVAPYIAMIIMAIVFIFLLKCKGDAGDVKSMQAKSDSLKWAMATLKEKDIAIDTLTAAAVQAGEFTMEAYREVDTLKSKLDSVQAYASGLAKNHWQAIKDNDTAAYKQNCDEMAGQLSDSRDSVNSLMALVNAFKYGVDNFYGAYEKEHKLTDSLTKELSLSNQAYKKVASSAIASFDSSIATIKNTNKPKFYIGGTVQVPFGFGPQLSVQTGNKIYSAGVLAGSGTIIYQVGAHIKLSFKKPSLNILK